MDSLTKKNHPTLCWSCKKACNKCSWSKYFQPVKGWNADATTITQLTDKGLRTVHSFHVKECPQYEYDGIFKISINTALAEQMGISTRTLYRLKKRRRK